MSYPSSLDELIDRLHAEFARDAAGPGAAALLEEYSSRARDWRSYAFFCEGAYTRNLLRLTDEFELLLLCWARGQRSPIHNHEGQNCWMAVLEGPIEEAQFQLADRPGPLEAGPVRSFGTGEVAFIRDEIGLHEVRATSAGPGASLHLYARPFDACNVYCPTTGRVTRKQLAYHSRRGVLVES